MYYTKIVNKTHLTFLYFTIIVSLLVIKTIQYPTKCDGSTNKIEKENIEKLQRLKIKTLDDFLNSSFIKKYSLRREMDSWPLRDGGYNNYFSFQLGKDKYSWFIVEVVTVSKNDPEVFHIGIMFHDESEPYTYPTRFTEQIKEISQYFMNSLDSTLHLKDVINYVQEQSNVQLHGIADASRKNFGNYSFRVGTVGRDLIISIDIINEKDKN